ncbi:threonine/homoserine/homoserine lactone efflux protein [Aurantimicrobium minutum]|uniref:LysE family translocator n=1 Tax=Aurantimicrobium minutum TaxID=708131 RepID=UPI0024757F2A|nr:LysE family translocator [Aurantimicrobium minutum]MDH6531920.1 threonine/homoserine/homoserine lactone efflux protein [Aurantimicrobium minutum]
METSLLLSAALFGFVTSLTPGPNNTYLLASGMNHGFRRSIPYMIGVLAGLALVFFSVIVGLGWVFTTLPVLYQILKWVGFAYICWMAWGIATSGTATGETKSTNYVGLWKALGFQFVNPKAWIVAASFTATYVPAGGSFVGAFLFTLVLVVATSPGLVLWTGLGQLLSTWLTSPTKRRVFNYTVAVVLVLSMVPVLFI